MAFTGKRLPSTAFPVATSKRQDQLLRTVEQLSRIQGGRGATWSPAGLFLQQQGTQFKLALATSGVTARSGSTLGTGTVTDVYVTATSPTAATITSSSTTFTAFNWNSTAVGSSKYCVCALIWDLWFVISAEC